MVRKYSKSQIFPIKGFPFNIQFGTLWEKSFPAHQHDSIELVFVLKGRAGHRYQAGIQELVPGNVFAVQPGQAHEFFAIRNLTVCNIVFDEEFVFGRAPGIRKLDGLHQVFEIVPKIKKVKQFLWLNPDNVKRMRDFASGIQRELEKRQVGFQESVMGRFIQMLVVLGRQVGPAPGSDENLPLRLGPVISLMHDQLADSISLRRLAKKANWSVPQFLRVFKDTMGQPPIDYLVDIRLKRACELLRSTESSITEISLECGFSDGNYFSRIFKQRLGRSPSFYRKYLWQGSYTSGRELRQIQAHPAVYKRFLAAGGRLKK